MKLTGRDAAAFCAKPDGRLAGAVVYGPDPGTVALARQDLVAALTEGDEMRLTRIDAAAARKDAALIDEAVRARGFFPGRRVVLVEGARDWLAKDLGPLLDELQPDDAFLVLEADSLAAKSALRGLFEKSKRLVAAGLYPEPPERQDITRMLEREGLAAGLTEDALDELAALARELDEGSLRQLVRTIALFGLDRTEPLDREGLLPLLPGQGEADLDALIGAVADGRVADIAPLMLRLTAAGTTPARILIATGQHFRRLLSVAGNAAGPDQAIGRLRPPLFGPRRQAFAAQLRRWGLSRLERAVRTIFDADRRLRSPGSRPDIAMVERVLIRLAMSVAR